jgi:hypothetical protein
MATGDPVPTGPSATTLSSRVVGITARFTTSVLGQVTAYAGAVAGAVIAFQQVNEPLSGIPVWARCLIIFSPIILALALHTLPALLAARRLERLKEITGSLKPGYFSLAPRDDEASFQRADGKHAEILHWLEQRTGRVLYLTGLSGSGKSSLLKAWALPKLERQNTRIITLRGYEDPVALLQQELKKPGIIWQAPPSGEHDTLELVKRASRHLSADRLLIVFDQFEECLILQDVERVKALAQLLSTLNTHPLPNTTFLLVFRSDYTGQIGELALPPLSQGDNWQETPPFTERAAQEFMLGSGLSVAGELLRGVLREAAEIEQTKGLIRPITINLCGLVLGRFANGVPRGFRPGELIRGFLRESIMLPSVREVAPGLLPFLITPSVTKVPQTIASLVKKSNQEPGVVRGCLLTLGQTDRGIVRPLDSKQETWEISHDFLVPLLDSILARNSNSLWRRVRPSFPWLAVAALSLITVWALLSSQPAAPPEGPTFGFLSPKQTSATEAYKALGDQLRKPTSFPVSRGGDEPVLKLEDVFGPVGRAVVARIHNDGKIVFHAVGSTGSTATAAEVQPDQAEAARSGTLLVADKMESDFREDARKPIPSFFFHLGDVIYHFGESDNYYAQFYVPYVQYPAPILGIAGNHDGMVVPGSTATPLQAYIENFCATGFHKTAASHGLGRTAQIQPGVYYTLEAPYVRILALYSNRTESGGVLSSEGGMYPGVSDVQLRFLEAALQRVKSEGFKGAVIIAVHHDPYSLSGHVGRSKMLAELDEVSRKTGVWPHAVLSANAHNYQRITRAVNSCQIPFVVAGNGGYGWARLHLPEAALHPPVRLDVGSDELTFESFDDHGFGFLRVTVDTANLRIEYVPVSSTTAPDSVTIDLKSRQVVNP